MMTTTPNVWKKEENTEIMEESEEETARKRMQRD